MQDLSQTLEGILTGNDVSEAILHNCLFFGGGTVAYGRERILELIRQQETPPVPTYFAGANRHAALFAMCSGYPVAIFADHLHGYITRLWYVSSASFTAPPVARLDVPFDPRFGASGASNFNRLDHPDLAEAHIESVQSTIDRLDLRNLVETGDRPLSNFSRTTPCLLRAFSDGPVTALLLMISALREDGHAGVLQFPVAVRLSRGCDPLLVTDRARLSAECTRSWTTEF